MDEKTDINVKELPIVSEIAVEKETFPAKLSVSITKFTIQVKCPKCQALKSYTKKTRVYENNVVTEEIDQNDFLKHYEECAGIHAAFTVFQNMGYFEAKICKNCKHSYSIDYQYDPETEYKCNKVGEIAKSLGIDPYQLGFSNLVEAYTCCKYFQE